MITVDFYIPTFDNEGSSFAAVTFASWEGTLTSLFGGFSKLPGTVTGQWADDGRVYDDTLVVYVAFIGSIADGGMVGEAATVACNLFTQEAITVRYLGLAEILS